jgi:hypothetical protein
MGVILLSLLMRLRRKYAVNISVLFLLFTSYSSVAGILPVSGTVKDYETGKPVAGAYVVLQWTGGFGIAHSNTSCYETRFTKTGKSGRYLQAGGKLPGPIGPFESNSHVFVYKRGYYRPSYRDERYPDIDKDDLVKFSGSHAERLEYLDKLTWKMSCYAHNSDLLPVYKLIYEEALELAESEQELQTTLDMCLDIARYEIMPGVERQDKHRDLKIAKHLNEHYPECLRAEHFMEAVLYREADTAASMLDNGMDPNELNKHKGNLYQQIKRSQELDYQEKLQYIILLTEKGGNPYLPGKHGTTPIMNAIRTANRGEPDKVALAIEMIKASSRNAYFRDMPYQARFAGVLETHRQDIIEAYITAGFRVDEPINDDLFLLMSCRSNLVQFLVDQGANVNSRDGDDRTALHHALFYRGGPKVTELIKNGVDVNAADIHGRTAIFYAVSNNNRPMVELLIDSGADVLKQDDQGKTPLWYARMQEKTHPGIIRELMLAGKQK